MTKLDEMIEEFLEDCNKYYVAINDETKTHLRKELRKFAVDVASAMLVRRNWTGEGIDWVSGYRMAFRDAEHNARSLGIEVEK